MVLMGKDQAVDWGGLNGQWAVGSGDGYYKRKAVETPGYIRRVKEGGRLLRE